MASTGIKGDYSNLWNELAKVDVYSEKYAQRLSEVKDAELRKFLRDHLAEKNVSDLVAIQNQMLIDAEKAREPLRGVERKNFDKEMAKVFRHLNVLMRQAPPDPNAKKVERAEVRSPDMEAAMSDEAKLRAEREANRVEKRRLAQEPEEKTVYPKPPEAVETKTLLQKIKDSVDNGVKAINAKVVEVRTDMETKQQIRKAVKEFKGQGNLLQILSANANKAINKIRSLGDRASARIMELKARAGRVAEQNMEISSPDPSSFRKGVEPDELTSGSNVNKADAPLPTPPSGAALTQ